MYRNFYSYNDMPQTIPPEKKSSEVLASTSATCKKETNDTLSDSGQSTKLLGKFELDDVLLIVIALILFADNCDDSLLLLAIGFIFISGVI